MKIKVIIIGEAGAYKHLNGTTQTVVTDNFLQDLSKNNIVVLIGGVKVDFNPKNLLFVNLQKVAQYIFDAKNWGTANAAKAYSVLKGHCETFGFKIDPQYNCPA